LAVEEQVVPGEPASLDPEQVRGVLGSLRGPFGAPGGARPGRRQEVAAPQGGFLTTSSRSLGNTTKDVSGQERRDEAACTDVATKARRRARYTLREVLWRESGLPRVRGCGRRRLAVERPVRVRIAGNVAHYAGVQVCGSIWSCPVCSAKIRAHRAAEISQAAVRHMALGGSIYMVTLTVRHKRHHDLGELLNALSDGFRRLLAGRAWQQEKAALGVVGTIRSTEVLFGGANGWHPHLHALVFVAGTPDVCSLARAIGRWERVWTGWTARHGFAASRERGVRWEPVITAEDAAAYIAKVQDGRPIGLEVARGDLKAGRLGNVTPFELLSYFRATGDLAGMAAWHEYERVTKHRQCITWSKGLRDRLLADQELSDEDVAAAEVGGQDVAVIPAAAWHTICLSEGLLGRVLEVVERGGFSALVELLAPYGARVLQPADP